MENYNKGKKKKYCLFFNLLEKWVTFLFIYNKLMLHE